MFAKIMGWSTIHIKRHAWLRLTVSSFCAISQSVICADWIAKIRGGGRVFLCLVSCVLCLREDTQTGTPCLEDTQTGTPCHITNPQAWVLGVRFPVVVPFFAVLQICAGKSRYHTDDLCRYLKLINRASRTTSYFRTQNWFFALTPAFFTFFK